MKDTGYKYYESNSGLYRVKDKVVERYEGVDLWVQREDYSANLLEMDSYFDYNGAELIDRDDILEDCIAVCNKVFAKKGSDVKPEDLALFKIYSPESIERVLN